MLQQLQFGDANERLEAASGLTQVNKLRDVRAAFSALADALHDQDTRVKTRAAQSLSLLIYRVRVLPKADAARTELVRSWEDKARLALIGLMSDTDADVRAAAATGLGKLSERHDRNGGWRPPGELAEALASGTAKWTRENAAAFYSLVDQTPPPELLTALKDPSISVRVATVGALEKFPSNLDEAIPTLLSMLEKDDSAVRKACLMTLQTAWPTAAAVPSLAESINHGSAEDRSPAIVLLGRIGPEASSTVPALLRILKEPLDSSIPRSVHGTMQQDAPCCAARALGLIASSDEVIEALAATLRSDFDYRHGAAAYGLAQIGDPARVAAPALVSAYSKWLDCKDQVISGHWMTTAVGRLGPHSAAEKSAVNALIRALDDKDRSIHLSAVTSLGKFGKNAASAIPKLRSLKAKDASPQIRDAASAALNAIEGMTQPPTGTQNPS
jgi:HEAT repeat protein